MADEQNGQNSPQNKSNKKVIIIVIILILLFTGSSFLQFIGGLPTLTNWLFTHGQKQPTLEEIIESTKPTAAREYAFKTPPKEVVSRTIDCSKLHAFTELIPKNPLCLNLYKTNAQEIDKEIQTGKYDRIILYGQYLIYDAPAQWEFENVPGRETPKDTTIKRDEVADGAYKNAYFNDQITVPALMKLYGLKDLSAGKGVLDKLYPYPAIYSRVSTVDDRKIVCKESVTTPGGLPSIGCAHGYWNNATYYPNSMSNEARSMPDQRVHRNGREDFLYFDQMRPANCFTDDGFVHEMAHNLLALSMYAGGHEKVSEAIHYFNEHQAGFAGDMYPEIACGDGNVINFHSNKDVKFDSIMAYNSIYPAGEMSSAHPTDNKCRLAVLTQWNRMLNAKNWMERSANFYTLLRDRTKTTPFQTEKDFIKFVSDASGDPQAKAFLNSYGCGL